MQSLRLAIVGDTQRVLPIERLAFHRETNDVGRRRIAQALLAESRDLLLHLGDLVGAASDYTRFERDYPPSELEGKPLRVCRGNHDCGGFWFGSPQEFNRRFAAAVGRLQTVELGFLRVLLLDTNVSAMSSVEWQIQLEQYRSALTEAEASSHVQHVLVAGHHPAFTNGRWHSPSKSVREAFVEPFLACSKARAFFAGHVHGYERFSINGRSFVVSGGGGGPRFSHLHGDKVRQAAELDLADLHPLHYLELEATPDAVACTVRGLDESSQSFTELERFVM